MRSSRSGYTDKKTPVKKSPAWKKTAAAVVLITAAITVMLTSAPQNADKPSAEGQHDDTRENAAEECFVRLLDKEAVSAIPLEEYILGVTAAEMPIEYEPEALKAQAVAARTYTLRKMLRGGCSRAEGADVCTDSGHCQAYADSERLKKRWGKSYEENMKKLTAAVSATSGEILTVDDSPIEALFCASAGGMTENSENVYTEKRSYLRSVYSPDAEGFEEEKSFTSQEIAERLGVSLKEAEEGIKVVSRFESGRVKEVTAGGRSFTGKKLRGLLSLRSANFTVENTDEGCRFVTSGFGHGVGMSQAGANAFAKEGMSYREILGHYYSNVQITRYDELL